MSSSTKRRPTVNATEEAQPFALSREEGEPLWLLGGLITLKATGENTGGQLTLMEAIAPPGFGVPLHTHEREHEAFYVLEGEMTFYLDQDAILASAGAFFSIPPGSPHGFEVRSESRFLDLRTPGGFEGFFRAAGEPAQARTLPPPGPPDVAKLMDAAPRFGMTILAPAPAEQS
jgi:quercetin dioxygenase-like cupin family protein